MAVRIIAVLLSLMVFWLFVIPVPMGIINAGNITGMLVSAILMFVFIFFKCLADNDDVFQVHLIVVVDEPLEAILILGGDWCKRIKHAVVVVPFIVATHHKGFLSVARFHLAFTGFVEVFQFNLLHCCSVN